MRATAGLLVLVGLLSFPLQARAEEVVYFTNGTYMHVLSHEVQGDMVRIRLDGDAALAFPSKLIEKIEGTYGVVFRKESTLQANQAAPSPAPAGADTPYPVGINPAIASRSATPTTATPRSQQIHPGGPIAGDTMVGSARAGPTGTHMLGNRLVVDGGNKPGNRTTFTPSPLQAKPGLSRPDNGLPPSSFPPPPIQNQPIQGQLETERQMPVEEPVPEDPESEGGP